MSLYWFSYTIMSYGSIWCQKGVVFVKVPFRSAPMPGIHKKRRGRCYRHIRTTNELRQNECAIADGHKQYVRKARCKGNIPTWYDDVRSSEWRDKSWKASTKRRKQYK